jgi:hypothetical protein
MTSFMTFMTVSLDSAESQCIRSERHVTSCRGGQVELVVWLAQMVPAMPSILGDRELSLLIGITGRKVSPCG